MSARAILKLLSVVGATCFGIACLSTPAEAQFFHPHHADTFCDRGFQAAVPLHAHHGRSHAIFIEPLAPMWIMPLRLPSVPVPGEPILFASGVTPIQTENFARGLDRGDDLGQRLNPLGKPARQRLIDEGPYNELEEIRRRVSVLKRSTPQGRQRADQLISSGDESFAKQVYARAITRYRDAIAKAPDYSEAHFRLAHAYVATRRYNLALKSALTALELAGTSRRDGFSLEDLYRGNKFARERHDETLFDAALREPEDGGLQFLIGFTLHYAKQPLQAREHFRDAMRFPGAHQAYVRQFLPAVIIAEVEKKRVDAN